MVFFFLPFLLELSICSIVLVANYSLRNSTGSPASALSFGSGSGYILNGLLDPITNQMMILYPNLSSTPPTFTTTYAPTQNTTTHKLHPNPMNPTPLTPTSTSISFSTQQCLRLTGPNFQTLYLNSTPNSAPNSTYIVLDCIFAGNIVDSIMVMGDTVSSQVMVGGYDVGSETGFGKIYWSYLEFLGGVQRNGLFYMLFSSGICICQIGATITEIMRFTWPANSASLMDVSDDFLAYCQGPYLKIYNITNNFSLFFNMTITQSLLGIKIFNTSQIVTMTVSGIYQYNILSITLTSRLLTTFSPTDTFDLISNHYITIHPKYPQSYSSLLFYDLNGTIATPPTTTLNSTTPPLPQSIQSPQQPQYQSQKLQFLEQAETKAKNIAEDAGSSLRLSSLRAAVNSFMMLIIILDDLEYYQYHKVNYTQSIQFAILNVNIVNSVRFDSWFLQSNAISEAIHQKLTHEEAIYKIQFPQNNKNPNYFYFLNAARPAYIDNLAICTFFYLCAKILYFVFYFLRNRHIIFMEICKLLKRSTKWWMLVAAFFENNMGSLTFSCFVQLQGPMVSCFNFNNKLNLCVTVFTLFCLIFYSSCFYLLIYIFSRKSVAKVLLSETECMGIGFFWESFTRITRNFIRCFFHGFFIFNYKMQIVGLAWSNVFYIFVTISSRKSFRHNLAFLSYLLYYLTFFIFDLVLAMKYLNLSLFSKVNFNLLSFIIICTLFGIFASLIIISVLRITIQVITAFLEKKARTYRFQKIRKKTPSKANNQLIPVIRLTNSNTKIHPNSKCQKPAINKSLMKQQPFPISSPKTQIVPTSRSPEINLKNLQDKIIYKKLKNRRKFRQIQ